MFEERPTAAPPARAALARVTVHVLAAAEFRLVGLHASEETVTGATRLMVAVCDIPLSVAVTVALWSVVTVPAVAIKVAVVAPAATVIEAGVVSRALLSDTVTVVAAVAACDNVTVQVLLADEFRLLGEHASDISVTGATRLIVAVWETPLKVAVTVAL